MSPPVRVGVSRAVREKRLLALLQGRTLEDLGLLRAVENEQVKGSLELAGIAPLAADGSDHPAGLALLRARQAVDPEAPLTVAALLAWHRELAGPVGLRTAAPASPPAAPPAFVASRLEILAQWLASEGARPLGPAQQGALVMARLLEIQPFDQANGRVARLAASHVMVQAGARLPILRGADAERLQQALQRAFRLETEPLTTLLDEAAGRALDLMIERLESPTAGLPVPPPR
jgi:fido (protein-threonine AMPylation protein)